MKQYIKNILFIPSVAKVIVRLLAKIHKLSYDYVGPFAIAAEGGLHPKHRLMNYHAFFVDNVSEGDKVLDIGCGNAALLRDVAAKTGAAAVGVDISEDNVRSARKLLSDFPKAEIIRSDIREYKSDIQFDAVILSNVLEHIDRRVELLKYLGENFSPQKFLLRVPMFEREWLVPYKRELGIESRLDPTHEIEYTEAQFRTELEAAALDIQNIKFQWGEIYAVVTPLKTEP